jgi:hypothetical protein
MVCVAQEGDGGARVAEAAGLGQPAGGLGHAEEQAREAGRLGASDTEHDAERPAAQHDAYGKYVGKRYAGRYLAQNEN